MGDIPADATLWDSGDWIEWHRTPSGLDERPCTAASPEPHAQLAALNVSLLRSAKSFFALTGEHLPVYQQIALVHAAVYCDVPLEGIGRNCEKTGVEILHLPPHGSNNIVTVDLSKAFATLIVVRIKDNFTCEARMIQRRALPEAADKAYNLRWRALPHKI